MNWLIMADLQTCHVMTTSNIGLFVKVSFLRHAITKLRPQRITVKCSDPPGPGGSLLGNAWYGGAARMGRNF